MKPLSQQIRDLVNEQPTSSYAIARQSDINKSAMSRFMNGGTLTMEKLDRLASVLGVVLTSEVSTVPRPLGKGRPSTKNVKVRQMDKKTASRWADQYAEEAFKNHASSRRGVWHIELLDCLLIYNNNPFKVSTIRPKEMKRITSQLNAIGISTLARGKGGEVMDSCGDHYTASLLLDCGVDRRPEVVAIVEDAAAWATDELDNYLQELRK